MNTLWAHCRQVCGNRCNDDCQGGNSKSSNSEISTIDGDYIEIDNDAEGSKKSKTGSDENPLPKVPEEESSAFRLPNLPSLFSFLSR